MAMGEQEFKWTGRVGYYAFPVADEFVEANPNIKELKTLYLKVQHQTDEFDAKAQQIRDNPRYTLAGQREQLRELGDQVLQTFDKLDKQFAQPNIQQRDKLLPKRFTTKGDPGDAAHAVRAAEIRTWLRSEGEVEAKLINAASSGDAEVVSALLTAPRGMFKLTSQSVRLAEQALAEKLDPEGAEMLKHMTAAVEAWQSILRAARQHISGVSGARNAHERLAEAQRTGVMPPAP